MQPEFDSLTRVMKARYSCRAFLSQPVKRDLIEQIVHTARRSPSWCNAQPWQLTITTAEETAKLGKALYEHASQNTMQPDLPWPEGYSGAYKARRFTCGMQLYDALDIGRTDKPARAAQMLENFRFFGAPHVAIVTSPRELGAYGALDAGGFVTAFTLAAQASGVASIAQAAPAGYAPFLRNYFGLSDDKLVLCAVSFGYADEAHKANSFRTERATTDEIIDWH
ncbi:nitroreductase [Lentibacter algarum]|uniref:nitroreductase n=1 Tax=Lentibacter algarum TaxID=576131 RepID=UPI001C06DAAD|nr:nitroreductase [Lentibacter algarum]MBU2980805.1 nitroreductase [Lentibacter algarum]